MKNVVKKIALLIATLIMFVSFGCSSAFAASCLFGHKAVATPSVEATCTEPGSYGGSYCSKCGKVIEEATVVPAKGHTQSEAPTLKPATTEVDGEYSYACVDCNIIVDSGVISKIDSESMKFTTEKYIYDGNEVTPTLEIKDVEGKLLVENQDYNVTYSEARINPGKYTVSITFIGNYEGTSELSFTILPNVVSDLNSTAKTANSISLSWSEVTGATGYQIYKYNSSTKKYEKIKTLTTNSYKVTGLNGNTTYKFIVRAYTQATDGTIIYGANSSVFSAKTTYGVVFTGSSAALYVGATKQLKATTAPANKTLTWKSSDTSIAKVSSTGKVTAVKNGTATITASFKYNGKTYKGTFTITVKKPSVKLNKTSATIKQGNTLKLTATTAPEDIKVTWKSSNTAVAKVSSTGKITARRSGTATITATITYKGTTYKSTCKVTVKQASPAENITRLINYIEKNGKTNAGGSKYIEFVDDDPAYDSVCTWIIIYDEICDNLVFRFNEESSYLDIMISAVLDRSGTYVDYKAEFIYDFFGYEYKAVAEDRIKASAYKNEYSVFGSWKKNTFPSYLKSTINEYLYADTQLAMTGWDVLMLKTADISFKDLGFTKITY